MKEANVYEIYKKAFRKINSRFQVMGENNLINVYNYYSIMISIGLFCLLYSV